MTGAAGPRAYTLRLGLGGVAASLADLREQLGVRVDDFDPLLRSEATGFRLTLTVPADDVWSAVLTAMAVVTAAGYPVETLDARRSEMARD